MKPMAFSMARAGARSLPWVMVWLCSFIGELPVYVILAVMLSERLRECGVVGAGGAGFPTYVKAKSEVEFLIANGAECEPLIHKDAEIMKHFPKEILAGMDLDDGRDRRQDRQVRFKDEERGISRSAEAQPEIRPDRVSDAGRFLSLGR